MAQQPTVAVPYGYREWRRANLAWRRAAGRAPGVTSGVGSTHPQFCFKGNPAVQAWICLQLCRLKRDDPFDCGEVRLSSLELAEELADQVAELSYQ